MEFSCTELGKESRVLKVSCAMFSIKAEPGPPPNKNLGATSCFCAVVLGRNLDHLEFKLLLIHLAGANRCLKGSAQRLS